MRSPGDLVFRSGSAPLTNSAALCKIVGLLSYHFLICTMNGQYHTCMIFQRKVSFSAC